MVVRNDIQEQTVYQWPRGRTSGARSTFRDLRRVILTYQQVHQQEFKELRSFCYCLSRNVKFLRCVPGTQVQNPSGLSYFSLKQLHAPSSLSTRSTNPNYAMVCSWRCHYVIAIEYGLRLFEPNFSQRPIKWDFAYIFWICSFSFYFYIIFWLIILCNYYL